MAKTVKREIALVDDSGVEWARAILTPAAVNRIIKLYKAQDIWLNERAVA